MNPHDPRHPWSRLACAARRFTDDRETNAPYGFSTRIAAMAFTNEISVSSLLERFALRAVGLASLLAILSVVANYSSLSKPVASEEQMPSDDPVTILLGE
jgi:hypothetical protein